MGGKIKGGRGEGKSTLKVVQTIPKTCKEAKRKKKKGKYLKNTVPSSAAKEKENFALQDLLSHKDSTIFAVITRQLIHTHKHMFNFLQLNSPIDLTEVIHLNNVTNVFKGLEDWGQIQR